MGNNYYGSICLTDIPKELITTAANGKKYLNIVVNERREASQYGHTHYIKVYVKKGENVPEGVNLYIGELKPSGRSDRQPQSTAPNVPPTNPRGDGLPF